MTPSNVVTPNQLLSMTLYSNDGPVKKKAPPPEISLQQDYLEASLAANVPSFPLADPFRQAEQYKDVIYLAIQHLMQAMYGCSVGLEKAVKGKKSKQRKRVAQSGAQATDQEYEPYPNHPLNDILNRPNPKDTFPDFVAQCVMNWNLHGRILIWARPNPTTGAPERFYCLPIPLCVPAFSVGSPLFPLGAWRIQQYYPNTGIAGILPNGLVGSAGAIVDAREVYEMRNPHPVYTWAPYSHLVGGNAAVDNIQNIDLSFWSIMAQGVKPAGFIDAPGADDKGITAIQNKIDNSHGGARKHGRPVVIGGDDPDRPGLTWNPLNGINDNALHEAGWEIYTSFVLALFGLDMSGVGLRRTGGHAERWAARRDERDTLVTFLSRLSATLTQGGLVRNWGLMNKGVRVTITLPETMGYEPAEMSRDMANDSSGTINEIRRLRSQGPLEGELAAFGDYPISIALRLMEKKLGIDEATQQEGMAKLQASLAPKPDANGNAEPGASDNKPEQNRPDTPDAAKGSLGGEGSGAPKITAKSADQLNEFDMRLMADFLRGRGTYPTSRSTALDELLPQEDTAGIIERILKTPVDVLRNGSYNGKQEH